jgi:hypothetical protein
LAAAGIAFVPGGVMRIAACDLDDVDSETVHEPLQLGNAFDLKRPAAHADGERFDLRH